MLRTGEIPGAEMMAFARDNLTLRSRAQHGVSKGPSVMPRGLMP